MIQPLVRKRNMSDEIMEEAVTEAAAEPTPQPQKKYPRQRLTE